MEGDITGLLEVTFPGSCLMEKYEFTETFGFARDVIGSTRRCTIVNNFIVILLKYIMAPSFISLDMFVFLLVHNNDECLGYQLADMMPFMPMILYKRNDLS